MASKTAFRVKLFPVASTPWRMMVEGLGKVGWNLLAGHGRDGRKDEQIGGRVFGVSAHLCMRFGLVRSKRAPLETLVKP